LRCSCGFLWPLLVTKTCLLTAQDQGLYVRPALKHRPRRARSKLMFLVTGITGKVGGATARHLLAQRKKVRALVRDRARAASWADQDVELVDGDWNNAAAIERALEGVDGAFVMLPAIWAPSPDFNEAKGFIANYVEALTKAAPPRVVGLSSMGANRTSGLGMITALSLMERGF